MRTRAFLGIAAVVASVSLLTSTPGLVMDPVSPSDVATLSCTPSGTPPEYACLEWLVEIEGAGGLATSDLTRDGMGEVIVGSYPGVLYAYDGITRQRILNASLGVYFESIAVGDLDGDRRTNVVTPNVWHGPQLQGVVQVFESTGSQLLLEWQSPDLGWPVKDLEIADIDADGTPELLAAAWDKLFAFVYDPAASTYVVKSFIDFFDIRRVATAQLDGDLPLEVLVTGERGLLVLDGASLAFEWQLVPPSEPRTFESWGVAIGDLDGIPGLEIVVAGHTSWLVIDPATRTITHEIPREHRGYDVQVVDLEGDGSPEIVGIIAQDIDYSGGSAVGYVDVYDGSSLRLEWRSPNLLVEDGDLNANRVLAGNADGDDAIEILASADGGVFQFEVRGAERNAPPVPSLVSGLSEEGETLYLDASGSSDPDGDPLRYRGDFDADGIWDTALSSDPTSPYAWGDDFQGTVIVEVTDGKEAATASATVTVANVTPGIGPIDILQFGEASVTLRVAGEKFHDVAATLYQNGTAMNRKTILRLPSNPNPQAVSLGSVAQSADRFDIAVEYTPLDDPENGQGYGATPVWLILDQNGGQTWIHHTFNVRHADTWIWIVEDLGQYLQAPEVELLIPLEDPGSDDLILVLDWGDGTSEVTQFLNDPAVGADPFPSPDTHPRLLIAFTLHHYGAPGTYTVTIAVTDDDGGTSRASVNVTVR